MILEGVHVWPGRVRNELEAQGADATVLEVFLHLDDEENHRSRLRRRAEHEPGRRGDRSLRGFSTIRRLQEALRRMARSAGVIEHDVSHPEDLTQTIVDQIVGRTSLQCDAAGTNR
jgi:2-phosphoglycerate kinase